MLCEGVPRGPTCTFRNSKKKKKKLGSPRRRVQVFAQFGTILEPKVRTVVVHVNGIGAIAAGGRQYDDRDFRQ